METIRVLVIGIGMAALYGVANPAHTDTARALPLDQGGKPVLACHGTTSLPLHATCLA